MVLIINKKIFIDSSILLAFIDTSNTKHIKVVKALEDLVTIKYRLYTSSQVIIDSYNLISKNSNIQYASEFLQTMMQSRIEILFPKKADFITAQRILKVNQEHSILLNEALNATLMQKKGIAQILTLDNWNKLFGTVVSNLL